MKKAKTSLCFLAIAIVFISIISPLSMNVKASVRASEYVPGEVIIGLKGASVAAFLPTISELGATIKRDMSQINAVVVRVTPGSEEKFMQSVKGMPQVAYVERNGIGEAAFTPNDPNWGLLWNMPMIKADKAWDTYRGWNEVTIAILDTGVDYTHDDLMANYKAGGYDWVNDDFDPMDGHSHGTHCAGIAAATLNNALGVAGVAQCGIWTEKILSDAGSGNNDDLASGILHAADHGVNVISMSLQNYPYSVTVENAVNYAYGKGVLLVAAAGNYQLNLDVTPVYPGSYTNVVDVSATTSADVFDSSYSNYGTKIEVSAPGTNVYSTIPTDSYGYKSGTSMACPHVAGLAALIWSYKPSLTVGEVRNALHTAVDDKGAVGKDSYYGYGRINCQKIIGSPEKYQYSFTLSPFIDRVWVNITSQSGGTLINGKVNITTGPNVCYPAPVLGWASGNNFQMVFDYRTSLSCYELGLLVGTISPAAGKLYRTMDGKTWVGPTAITLASISETSDDSELGQASAMAGEPAAIQYVEGLNPAQTVESGRTYSAQEFGIRYVPTVSYALKKVELMAGGGSGLFTLQLRTESAGYPSSTVLKQVTFTMSNTMSWQGVEFDTAVPVTAGTAYWIVFTPVPGSRTSTATAGTLVTHVWDYYNNGPSWDGLQSSLYWMARFYKEVQPRFQYRFTMSSFADRIYVNVTSQTGFTLIYGLVNLTYYSQCYPAPVLGWSAGGKFVMAFDYRTAIGSGCFELGFLTGTTSPAGGKLYRTIDGVQWYGPTTVTLNTFAETSDAEAKLASAS